jgi:putative nucleotidyltransferase with HDIG domain
MRVLFQRVAEKCDLPPLPVVATRALVVARDPDTTVRQLARLVSTDAALAARVLRIARSPMYLRRIPPSTLEEAVMAVGFDALRQIITTASARSVYRANDRIADALWAHSLATALAADELAAEEHVPRGGNTFIAGLLHDIGKLVFYLSDPQSFPRLGHADDATEEQVYGVTHAAVGACLAEQWGIDDAVVEAVMFHHKRDASGLARCIATADAMAEHIGFGSVPASSFAAPVDELSPLEQRVLLAFEEQRTLFS